jgi:hypothetical protein
MVIDEQHFSTRGGLRRRGRRIVWGLGILLALAALAVSGFHLRRPKGELPSQPAEDDPRRTFATPFRNVRPEVRYVDDESCADCHADHAARYGRHPMGRSLTPVARAEALERYGTESRNPFQALGATFQVEHRDGKVLHREVHRDEGGWVVAEVEAEVHYALGSGRQGRTYLIQRGDGFLFQSPISWYSRDKGIWDLSPSYEQFFRGFRRPITIDCLFCHSNRVEPVEHTLAHYREPIFRGHAIGCQRCHGPGERHVAGRQNGEVHENPDPTIVNPGRLEPALREAVCQQCHLLGEVRIVRRGRGPFDYRPGLPLDPFLSIFVHPPEKAGGDKSVGHVEQMYASGCFRASVGRLGCISCHDPHEVPPPAGRVAFYRDRCLRCHGESACGLPLETRRHKNPEDSCIDCHMPRGDSASIAHAAVTDHRIPRNPARSPRARPGQRPEEPFLVAFPRDRSVPLDPDTERDLARAMIGLARGWNFGATAQLAGRRSLPLLDRAVREAPEDVEASADLAFAFWLAGRPEDALAACETTLARASAHEVALGDAAFFATTLGRRDRAVEYWRRFLKVSPWNESAYFDLARTLAERGEWDEGLSQCRAGLRIDPTSMKGRMFLVMYYAKQGRPKQARAEFDTLLALKPPGEEMLRRWFASLRLP